MAKEKDYMKGKRSESAKSYAASGPKNVTGVGKWCQYKYKGPLNKGNDGWLNTMLQCINHLTLRNTILACANEHISPLVSALIKVMRNGVNQFQSIQMNCIAYFCVSVTTCRIRKMIFTKVSSISLHLKNFITI